MASKKIIEIPTIMAFINPFSVVVRENEEWKPSIDDINESSYDYVKLNRTSTAIDIGIAPLSMIIGFDGSLILPCIKEYADVNKAVDKFNETLGYLFVRRHICRSDFTRRHIFWLYKRIWIFQNCKTR